MSTLLLVAVLSDLLSPILIAKAGLPPAFRWLSQVALALMILVAFLRLLRQGHMPKPVWLVVVFTMFGGAMGLVSGQGAAATAWGWWLMFKYPLVGLYAYLQPSWPRDFATRLRVWCIRLLCLEAAVQSWQYVAGEVPGDNLAGTLGVSGTGHLVILVLWVLALALGDWIARGKLFQLALVIGLGAISSLLGEMKLFFFAAVLMGVLALGIRARRVRLSWQMPLFALLLVAVLWLFPMLYDVVVPGSEATSFAAYFDPGFASRYFSNVGLVRGAYDVGRNYGLAYAWQRASADPLTLIFGEGMGARGESKTLGSVGVALLSGDLGLFTGSSLVVLLGELGLTGLLGLAGLLLAIIRRLWRAIGVNAEPQADGLRYALLLFTLMWPLWLWYTTAWVLPLPALLYWMALGYALGCPADSKPSDLAGATAQL